MALLVFIAATKFAHVRLVWIEEAYGSAAAAQLLRGQILYRDLWFDKPPLYAGVYLLWGAQPGWPLRLGGTALLACTCLAAYLCTRTRFGERESITAAGLTALYLTFGVPSAVLAVAPDLLMVLPHLIAIYFAWRNRPVWSGVSAGFAFLCNTKGVLVLFASLLWQWRAAHLVLLGWLMPVAGSFTWLAISGALPAYLQQVWKTGWLYARDTFVIDPMSEAFRRSLNWAGFHLLLLAGSAVYWFRTRDWRSVVWTLLLFASVFAGWRFSPRYYFALIPPLVLGAARGIWLLSLRQRLALCLLAVPPIVRFGPAYVKAASGMRWPDIDLMEDSREAAQLLKGGSLFVWGYRPDVYVFSGLPAGTPYLDSQPISGVFADRHLFSSHVSIVDTSRQLARLQNTRPRYVVDGLGVLNPDLALIAFKPLQGWISQYREVGRTHYSIIYVER